MIDAPTPTRIRLSESESLLKRVVPGAGLSERGGGITASWYVSIEVDHYLWAASHEHAEAFLTTLGERMRARAIRDLGLEPVLEAHRAEAREFREANVALDQQNKRLAQRVTQLEARVEVLLDLEDSE